MQSHRKRKLQPGVEPREDRAMSVDAIAEELSVTPQRVYQLETSALLKLSVSPRLRELLNESIEHEARRA